MYIDFDTTVGIRWYTILLMVIGGVILLGIGFGVWKYVKKRQDEDKKISLVT